MGKGTNPELRIKLESACGIKLAYRVLDKEGKADLIKLAKWTTLGLWVSFVLLVSLFACK